MWTNVPADEALTQLLPVLAACAGSPAPPSDLLETGDLRSDPRFIHAPLLIGEQPIRFFAGVRLESREGASLGWLCVLDTTPRELTGDQRDALRAVARRAAGCLSPAPVAELSAEVTDTAEHLRLIIDTSLDCVKVVSPEGRVLEMNPAGLAMLEATSLSQIQGLPLERFIAPEQRAAFQKLHARVLAGGSGSLAYEAIGLAGGRRWLETQAVPLRKEGRITSVLGITRDINARRQAELQDAAERRVLEQLVGDTPLLTVLDLLAREYEQLFPGMLCSILLLDSTGKRLRCAAAPGLPRAYVTAFDGIEIGPGVGSCGTAAYTGQTVITSDIAADPGWQAWKSLAYRCELSACWSVPILCRVGKVLGTFALYYREPRTPREDEVAAIERGARLAGLAILRHQALNDLRQSEDRFYDLLQAAPDAILIVDEHHTATLANSAAEMLFGFGPGELNGRPIADLVPLRAREQHAGHCTTFFHSASARLMGSGLDLKGCRKDGTEFFVDIMLGPLKIDGTPLALCIVRDISERMRTEAELRETQERLQRAATAGGVGLWDWDVRTGKVYYSPEWKRQIGCDDDEVSDDLVEWNSRIHPDDVSRVRGGLQAHLSGGAREFELEFRFRHKDGTYRHILTHGSRITDAEGLPVRMLGANVDITHRTELEAQLRQSQKMEAVGRLAGGVAHDFNNMLAVIGGYSELLLARLAGDDPRRTMVEDIARAGKRAAGLTRQLLAFSRNQVLAPKHVDLNHLIQELRSMLGPLLGEDIELTTDLGANLPPVYADPGQLEQVLMNLTVNARDAMPQGGHITISTRLISPRESAGCTGGKVNGMPGVCLSVRDCGSGMPAEVQAHIFEPFYTTKAFSGGTGLGLAVVQGIVEQSGGVIRVESHTGEGTTFSIFLPAVDGEVERATEVEGQGLVGGNETVLLVEDENDLRLLLQAVLEQAGYRVLPAASGADALRMVEEFSGTVHLLVTDVVMPGMSGLQLAEQLTARDADLRVLYLSGYTDDAVLRHGILADKVPFLQKPFSPADFARRVRELLSQRAS